MHPPGGYLHHCGGELINITCLRDPHWHWICTGCDAHVIGERNTEEHRARGVAEFEALQSQFRQKFGDDL